MRVLYCSDTYPPQVNGVSVVTELSVNGMLRRGWECAVVAPRYAEPELVPADYASELLAAAAVRTRIASIPLPIYPEVRAAAPAYPPSRARSGGSSRISCTVKPSSSSGG